MFCVKCNAIMKYVMRFDQQKAYQLYRCPKCYFETKETPLFFMDDKLKQENGWRKGRESQHALVRKNAKKKAKKVTKNNVLRNCNYN